MTSLSGCRGSFQRNGEAYSCLQKNQLLLRRREEKCFLRSRLRLSPLPVVVSAQPPYRSWFEYPTPSTVSGVRTIIESRICFVLIGLSSLLRSASPFFFLFFFFSLPQFELFNIFGENHVFRHHICHSCSGLLDLWCYQKGQPDWVLT